MSRAKISRFRVSFVKINTIISFVLSVLINTTIIITIINKILFTLSYLKKIKKEHLESCKDCTILLPQPE